MFFDSIIITGPTASGKSDFAHKIAKSVNGAIINCDSVQIYKGIENISASPFAEINLSDSIDGILYKLFSIIELDKHLSVVDYLNLVKKEIKDLSSIKKIPIFVGGTGYYIDALINGVSDIPDISLKYRKFSREIVQKDISKAKELLCNCNIPKDPQRISRALEVFLQTGTCIENLYQNKSIKPCLKNPYIILINPDKDIINERIKKRIDIMMKKGAFLESKNIIKNNLDSKRAIGLSEICDFLENKISKEECINNWYKSTVKYAKRQRTWFRNKLNPNLSIFNIPKESDLQNVLTILKDNLS